MKMIRKLLLLLIVPGFLTLAACGGDDETLPIDEGNGNNEPQNVDELSSIFGGTGKDSVVWTGKQWLQADWDPLTLSWDVENEDDITNDPGVNFNEHEIWFRHDDYNTPRLGYPVGKGKWIDPMGKTGFYYEFHAGVMDTIFVNAGEAYPPGGGRQDWVIRNASETEIEFTREWRYGGRSVQDRFIWTLKPL